MAANGEKLSARLPTSLKKQLDAAILAKRTSQQAIIEELIRWFVAQDGLVQSAVIGQIKTDDEIARLIVQRLGPGKKRRV